MAHDSSFIFLENGMLFCDSQEGSFAKSVVKSISKDLEIDKYKCLYKGCTAHKFLVSEYVQYPDLKRSSKILSKLFSLTKECGFEGFPKEKVV